MRDMKSSQEFKIITRYENRNSLASLFQVLVAAASRDREWPLAMNALCLSEHLKKKRKKKNWNCDDDDEATPNRIYINNCAHHFSAFAKFHDRRWQFPENVRACVAWIECVATARATIGDETTMTTYSKIWHLLCVRWRINEPIGEWVQSPQRHNKNQN